LVRQSRELRQTDAGHLPRTADLDADVLGAAIDALSDCTQACNADTAVLGRLNGTTRSSSGRQTVEGTNQPTFLS